MVRRDVTNRREVTDTEGPIEAIQALFERRDRHEPEDRRRIETIMEALRRADHDGPQSPDDEGLSVQQRRLGRHDRYVPKGFEFKFGSLSRSLPDLPTHEDQRVQRDDEILGAIVERLVDASQHGELGRLRVLLEKVHEELFGYPYGERWRKDLAYVLERDAFGRKESELREKEGMPARGPSPLLNALPESLRPAAPPTVSGPATGTEILAWLGRLRVAVPEWLTADLIEEMRGRVRLGEGVHGRGRPARELVDEYARKYVK